MTISRGVETADLPTLAKWTFLVMLVHDREAKARSEESVVRGLTDADCRIWARRSRNRGDRLVGKTWKVPEPGRVDDIEE